ncbi:hypothetical protein AM587_10001715 [Phytophthora nicotianae]|uniref:Uncharacterized protein n=1 Tax=Phytophthora nicotianae TaxID=4792 RepID=A0A0W8CKX9_PHYNI|nr:hypothetical protein AM587_10001715 [Phytophthora nicotianae]
MTAQQHARQRPPPRPNRPPAPSPREAAGTTPSRRTSPQPRSRPSDSQFEESLETFDHADSPDVNHRASALATVPPPVSVKSCVQLWIPASRLTREYGQSEIMSSLADPSQPEIWRTHLEHLRDFQCYAGHGISFVCVNEEAQQALGNQQLSVCGSLVMIRKYSKYDKLYYVDLRRLPKDTSDRTIYDYFVKLGCRPVLIAPTQIHGQIKSRDRTVYFKSTVCPAGLKLSDKEAIREIHFNPADPEEKPCFVQHRTARYNRVKPPSLRPQERKTSDASDASMSSAEVARSGAAATAPSTSNRLDPRPGSPAETQSPDSSPSTTGAPPLEEPLDSSPSELDATPLVAPPAVPKSRAPKAREPQFILGSVDLNDPDWMRVQHSQYGILNHPGEKYLAPEGQVPCELTQDDNDPHSLRYKFPVCPNYYAVLTDEGFDDTLPPDMDIFPHEVDGDDEDSPCSGYTADSDLLPYAEQARATKDMRKLPNSVEQVTAAELQRAIDEFLKGEVLNYTCHEDTLAAIHVQPAYFRWIFRLPENQQHRLFKQHAMYRAVCADPIPASEWSDYMDRLTKHYGVDLSQTDAAFSRLFPNAFQRKMARNVAICDLFLMIFAPRIYIDPVKVFVLPTDTYPAKRLRHSPFLLWSDVNLLRLARCDDIAEYGQDERTPELVVSALRNLAYSDLPAATATASPSRWVHPSKL